MAPFLPLPDLGYIVMPPPLLPSLQTLATPPPLQVVMEARLLFKTLLILTPLALLLALAR